MSNGLILAVVLGIVTLFTFMDRSLPVSKGDSITPRTIEFSGYTWSVKRGRQPRTGLIANYFLDWEENVWVDKEGLLHLRIIKRNGRWYCAEIASQKSFGYGKYIFYLATRVDQLDENVVFGLFTWGSSPSYYHREIDIEFSRWGQSKKENTQFVIQPGVRSGNCHRFDIRLKEDYSTHSFDWREGSINFESLYGYHSIPPYDNYRIESWNYTGKSTPKHKDENVRINLWLFNNRSPSDGMETEVIVKKFEFVPQAK